VEVEFPGCTVEGADVPASVIDEVVEVVLLDSRTDEVEVDVGAGLALVVGGIPLKRQLLSVPHDVFRTHHRKPRASDTYLRLKRPRT
jgi:hypothetical protein